MTDASNGGIIPIRWSVRVVGNRNGEFPPDGYVWARTFEEAVAEARKFWPTGWIDLTPLGARAYGV